MIVWRDAYLRLHRRVALKRLEEPCLYHLDHDELYELDEAALTFLARCDGTRIGASLTTDGAFVEYCLAEGLLEALAQPMPRSVAIGDAPTPSLRYLELQLLHRCNLRCRHCYLDVSHKEQLELEDALAISREFAALGGLRLLISGGEPLLYPALREFIEATRDLGLRRVVLTNGTLLTSKQARWLEVEELQFSLDGWRTGHELLRGAGTFDLTLRGIQTAREVGIPLSIATMVHRGNREEFDRLQQFVTECGAREWGIDVPCVSGTLAGHPELLPSVTEAALYLTRAFGGGYHGSTEGYACGRHLMTVLPSGFAAQCGFYADTPLGDARTEGLAACWQRARHLRTADLECRNCPVVDECAGGCRFRAGAPLAPDLVMCALYGQPGPS